MKHEKISNKIFCILFLIIFTILLVSCVADETKTKDENSELPTIENNSSAEINTASPLIEDSTEEPTASLCPTEDMKWETFYALSAEDKDKYLQSFDDYGDFVTWMKDAQERFKEEHPDILIGADGSFNLEDLLK